MKKILIIIFCFFSLFFMNSKEIKIKVIDKDINIPLEGVQILIKNTGQSLLTDASGMINIEIPDEETRLVITANLIGYETLKKMIKDLDKIIYLHMSIEGVLEGKELVIEEEKIGSKDEELGVSTVMDSDELEATSETGFVEDVMSTVKTLPGVIYSGRFGSDLSVRGGYPNEFTTVYDGFMIRYPYIWGGAYSIFNPNVIESIKFSPGIFGVKHGYASSALLEMEGIKPNEGLQFMTKLSTMSYEVLLQTPLWSKNTGLLVGGRIFFWDLPIFLNDFLKQQGAVPQDGISTPIPPYFRSTYLKWFWKPNDRFEWYVNGLFNVDGTSFKYDGSLDPNTTSDISTSFNFLYYNYYAYGFTGFKILPTDKILIHFLSGYEFLLNGISSSSYENGTQKYSDDFVTYYNNMGLAGYYGALGTDFTLKDFKSYYTNEDNLHSVQTRIDFDFTLHERVMLSTGIGTIYDYTYSSQNGKFYTVEYDEVIPGVEGPVYRKTKFSLDKEDKSILKSFLYVGFNFIVIPDTITIDVGSRLDHNVIFGQNNEWRMNTIPVPGPRLNMIFTPIKNLKFLNKFSISAGVGLFSKVPLEETAVTKAMGLKDFDIPIPKVLSTVLGFEFQFPLGFKFKIEGYYKYAFNRMYMNSVRSEDNISIKMHADGIGHIAGFDVMLQRKISRYFDGYISYSFVYARYYNPQTDGMDSRERMMSSDPRGVWYYPSFHRFHNLNIVLNFRPTPWFTITPKLTFATGIPKAEQGDPEPFAAVLEDGTVVEMWNMEETYSDELRSDFSIPFDIRFGFNFYFPKSKLRFEAYAAVKDLFIFAYSPKSGTQADRYTGEEQPRGESGFNFAIPEFSFGIELSF